MEKAFDAAKEHHEAKAKELEDSNDKIAEYEDKLKQEFGPGRAREKLRLLASIGPLARLSPRRLGRLRGDALRR